MIEGLLFAWILSLFGFNELCKTAMNELFNVKITNASYYFGFFFDRISI